MPGVSESRTWDALLTTTLANYRNKLEDNIFDVYPLLSWALGKLGQSLRGESGKLKRTEDGGESIVEQLMYELNSTAGPYSGYETLNVTPQEGMTIGRFSWRQYAVAVSISGLEKRSNSGEAKMLDIVKAKIKQAEMSLRDRMSRDFWGSNSDGKSIDGLGIIVSSSATCGGLSPTTFTWWVPTVTASGSFATQGLKDMRTLFNTLSWGNETVDGIFATQDVYQFFETSLQPLERYTNTKAANAGFVNLTFKGQPVLFDRDAPSGTIHMLYSECLSVPVHRDADFEATPFMRPVDQDATTSQILWQGNLTTGNRRKHGKLTGITA